MEKKNLKNKNQGIDILFVELYLSIVGLLILLPLFSFSPFTVFPTHMANHLKQMAFFHTVLHNKNQ